MSNAEITDLLLRLALISATGGVIAALWRIGKAILRIHEAILIFMGEHELLAAWYSKEHEIPRHNMRTLAQALSRTPRRTNGQTH
jgi:hypothetical protein